MRVSAPRALATFVCVLWTTLSAAAWSAPAEARRVVLLAASDAEQRALAVVESDLRELVEPLTLRAPLDARKDKASLGRLAREQRALAAVWLEQSASGYVSVYVFDPQTQRLGMRRLPRRSQADADESIGVVLRATLEALLEGREAPLEAVPLPAAPAPPPAPPAPRRERAALRTGYVGVGFAEDSLEHGASFGASLSLLRWLGLGASYAVVQPAELRAASTSVTLRRRPLDTFVSLGTALSSFELLGDLGASFDFRERRSEVSDQGLRASAGASYAVVSLLGRVRLARELWPQLRFDIGPAFELPLNEPELVVERAAGDATISTYGVRPRLEAGVSLVIR